MEHSIIKYRALIKVDSGGKDRFEDAAHCFSNSLISYLQWGCNKWKRINKFGTGMDY